MVPDRNPAMSSPVIEKAAISPCKHSMTTFARNGHQEKPPFPLKPPQIDHVLPPTSRSVWPFPSQAQMPIEVALNLSCYFVAAFASTLASVNPPSIIALLAGTWIWWQNLVCGNTVEYNTEKYKAWVWWWSLVKQVPRLLSSSVNEFSKAGVIRKMILGFWCLIVSLLSIAFFVCCCIFIVIFTPSDT